MALPENLTSLAKAGEMRVAGRRTIALMPREGTACPSLARSPAVSSLALTTESDESEFAGVIG